MSNKKSFEFYKKYANDFAKNELGQELNIPVIQNNRTKSLGSFISKGTYESTQNRSGQIAIRLNLKRTLTHEDLIGVIKHEVIHWYCYVNHLDFNDGDKDFERMLYKHNAPSTYFGMEGKEQSQFIQAKIMNDEVNNLGFKATSYKKCDPSECYQAIKEADGILININGLTQRQVRKSYTVYYHDKKLGYVFSTGNKWIMVDDKGALNHPYQFKSRKDAVIRYVFDYENKRVV